MVKVTIEHDGGATVLQGELFLGGVMTDAGDRYEADLLLVGRAALCQLPDLVGNLSLNLITDAFMDDPPIQAKALRDLSDQVSKLVQDYLWR